MNMPKRKLDDRENVRYDAAGKHQNTEVRPQDRTLHNSSVRLTMLHRTTFKVRKIRLHCRKKPRSLVFPASYAIKFTEKS